MSDWTGRIGLSVEAPGNLLFELREETELDFAIAHRVIEDPIYARYFRERPKGREMILDNSLHELGASISLDMLARAAALTSPDYIISPDKMEDCFWTINSFRELQKLKLPYKIAVSLVGRTPEERAAYLAQVREADMLCLPYDRPRYLWYIEQFPFWRRVHLLGVSELSELRAWLPFKDVLKLSVDTGKATKYGLLGKHLRELRSLRKASLKSLQLLEVPSWTPDQLRLVIENTRYLRTFLA